MKLPAVLALLVQQGFKLVGVELDIDACDYGILRRWSARTCKDQEGSDREDRNGNGADNLLFHVVEPFLFSSTAECRKIVFA